jgi:hypothetical protein
MVNETAQNTPAETPKAPEGTAGGTPDNKTPAAQAPAASATDAAKPAEGAAAAPAAKPEGQVEGAKPDAAKAGEAAKPEVKDEKAQAPVVPEKYDLKLAEKSLADAGDVEKVTAFAKANKLSNEQAQALLDQRQEAKAAFALAQTEQLVQKQADWRVEVESDKEIGGTNLKESAVHFDRFVDTFASDKLKAIMKETKLGDHPEFFRMGVRIGKAMADDKVLQLSPHRGNYNKSVADTLYPTTAEKEGTGA